MRGPMRFALLLLLVGCVHRFPGSSAVPAAAEYRTPSASSAMPPLATRVHATVASRDLVHDMALDRVAQVLADAYGNGHEVPGPLYTAELLWRSGVPATYDRMWTTWVSGELRMVRLEESLREQLEREGAQNLRGRHYGVSFASAHAPSTIAMILVEAGVALQPLKTRYAPGEALTVAGRALVSVADRILAYVPGEAEPRSVPVKEDGTFEPIQLTAPVEPGRYYLELTRWEQGDRPLLLVPITVGTPQVEPIDVPVPSTAEQVEAWVRAHVASVRASLKLPPLVSDERADALARKRAEQKNQAGDVASALGALGLRQQVGWAHSASATDAHERAMLRLLRPSEARTFTGEGSVLAVGAAEHGDEGWTVVVDVLDRK